MRILLTDRFCGTARNASSFFDEKVTGLTFLVSGAGGKSWYFSYTRPDGRRTRFKSGNSPLSITRGGAFSGIGGQGAR